MPVPGVPFTDGLRRNVNRLADGLLPLAPWIATKPYIPDAEVPWRNGATLTAAELGFDRFLEALLIETSEDSDLKARWDWLADAPLRLCPTPDVAAWRSVRGLAATPRFSAVVSENVLVDADTRLVSRAEFYLPFWPILATAYQTADQDATQTGRALDESAFGAALLKDESPFWLGSGVERSSRFCRQFVKDILYCYLGLRNPQDEPWRTAVLVELGERRRVGNMYSPADCEAAVTVFNAVLEALRNVPQGTARVAQRLYHAPPIGSPPVNARDLA